MIFYEVIFTKQKPQKRAKSAKRRKLSPLEELERFAKDHPIDLKGKVDFDDEYDEYLKKKYKRMGFDI